MLPCGHSPIYCLPVHSYDLCFEPHIIMSRYAFTIKQTTKNDCRKITRYKKINVNDRAIFCQFFQMSFCAGNKS